jgi:hypothetical protein
VTSTSAVVVTISPPLTSERSPLRISASSATRFKARQAQRVPKARRVPPEIPGRRDLLAPKAFKDYRVRLARKARRGIPAPTVSMVSMERRV